MVTHLQKSNTKSFATQLSPIAEDTKTQELNKKISETTIELERAYESHLSDLHSLTKDINQSQTIIQADKSKSTADKSQIALKNELNKIITENKKKKTDFNNLKFEIELLIGQPFDDSKAIPLENINYSNISQEKLENDFEKIKYDIELAENEQNCIKNMLRKEKDTILVFRERFLELNEAHRKITKSYAQAVHSNKKAWNNLTLITNQIASLKKDKIRRKSEYQASCKSKKNFKIEKEKDISKLIESISYNCLLNTEKQEESLKLKSILKEKLFKYDNNQKENQDRLKYLRSVDKQIQIINEVLNRSGIDKLIILNKEGVELLIESFNHLKYQESSLSSRFQSLTSESLERTKEFEKYSNKLDILINENSVFMNFNSSNLTQTFNQLKEKLENSSKIDAKSDEIIKEEENVLKTYLEILNIPTSAVKFMQKIKENVNALDPIFLSEIKGMNIQLDGLKRGFFYKKEIIGDKASQHSRKAMQKLTEYNDITSEYYIQEISPYYSLTYSEVLLEYFRIFNTYKNAEKIWKFIKKQPILYSFITLPILSNYFDKNKTIEEATNNLHQLIAIGHMEYQAQFIKVVTLTLEIIQKIKEYSNAEVLKFKSDYPHYDPQNPKYFDPLMRLPRRKSIKIPTLIKDKTENRFNATEEIRELQQMYKTYEVVTKARRASPNFEQNKGKNIVKSAKLLSLESPKDVLKEVLSIESHIKRIKSKERKAEFLGGNKDMDCFKLLRQPWTPRLNRPKTQEKGIGRKIAIELLTPRSMKRELDKIIL